MPQVPHVCTTRRRRSCVAAVSTICRTSMLCKSVSQFSCSNDQQRPDARAIGATSFPSKPSTSSARRTACTDGCTWHSLSTRGQRPSVCSWYIRTPLSCSCVQPSTNQGGFERAEKRDGVSLLLCYGMERRRTAERASRNQMGRHPSRRYPSGSKHASICFAQPGIHPHLGIARCFVTKFSLRVKKTGPVYRLSVRAAHKQPDYSLLLDMM